jgi:hypothetical protein
MLQYVEGRQYLVYCRIIPMPAISFVIWSLQLSSRFPFHPSQMKQLIYHLSDSFRSSKDEIGKLGNL